LPLCTFQLFVGKQLLQHDGDAVIVVSADHLPNNGEHVGMGAQWSDV
jgi:hypothetical protein